jgi:hypothetical protein
VKKSRLLLVILVVIVCVAIGTIGMKFALDLPTFAPIGSTGPSPAISATSAAETSATPTSSKCHSVNGLPDHTCTPGLADPRVTQANIHTTICVSGSTTTVRPPSSYTTKLKVQQIADYGYVDTNLADYEEDHLIPLELGGHPTDAKNLWPELLTGNHSARQKDVLENSLHARVCAGLMTLAAAQMAIATNWES